MHIETPMSYSWEEASPQWCGFAVQQPSHEWQAAAEEASHRNADAGATRALANLELYVVESEYEVDGALEALQASMYVRPFRHPFCENCSSHISYTL